MSDRSVWVGLDLGNRQTRLCVVDDLGAVLHEQLCATTLEEIEAALAHFPRSTIALIAVEACCETHIVRKLRASGFRVAIFESRKTRRFLEIRRNKTDSGDARGLADMARLGRQTVSQVRLKSVECQQLRSELLQRHKLTRVRVAVEASIRSRLALYGRAFKPPYSAGAVRRHAEEAAAQLLREEGIDLRAHLAPLVDVAQGLRSYLRDVDRSLGKRARANEACARMMEVPGVGPICALSFFSAVEDPERFRRTADIGAYLGLVPRCHQSGETHRTLRITKAGNSLTRQHLVTAASVLRSKGRDCALKDWAIQIRGRVGPGKTRVALARKIAIVLLTLWKTGAPFEAYPEPRPRHRA